MIRLFRSSVLVLLAVSLVALAGTAGASGPRAHSAGTCHVGNSRGYGYSYLTWLWVNRTSCATGRNVAKHHGHLNGWHCKKHTIDNSPVQYDAKVTCKSGRRQVQWTYTQNK